LNKVTQEQFRDLVVQDVLGGLVKELRSEPYLELWITELYDLYADTEIKLSLLDDSEFQQGAMNHPNAVENTREAIRKTEGFLKFISFRIKEAREIQKTSRSKPFWKVPDPKKPNWAANFGSLNKEYKLIKIELLRERHANSKLSTTLDKAFRQLEIVRNKPQVDREKIKQEREALITHYETIISQQRDRLNKVQEVHKSEIIRISEERQDYRNLLAQVIMRWEDNEIDADLIEQIKLAIDWNVPFGERPIRLKRKTQKKDDIAS
jgi:hypothetical protein